MRILYLHQYFNTPDMNGGTRSYEMAKRLVRKGHEVHLITSRRKNTKEFVNNEWAHEVIDGINIYWLVVPYNNKMSFFKRVVAFFTFALKAGSKAVTLGGDLVFATSTPLTIAIPAVHVKKKLNIPMVFEVRDLWPELPIAIGALKNPILKWAALQLEKYAYKNAERVVALSPGMKDGVLKLGYQLEGQVAMIPNSSDLDSFSEENSDSLKFRSTHPEIGDRPIILYAGTFGVINGVAYAVDLAVEMQKINSDICFVLLGEGAERGCVESKAKALGVLGANVFIYNAAPKNEMPNAFAAADIALSLFVDLKPMRSNSANKFFDALASSTPVVINYGGWQKEIISEENIGFSLWGYEIKAAAEFLNIKMQDKIWLKNAALNARELAKERFSRDELVSKLENVFLSVVAGVGSS